MLYKGMAASIGQYAPVFLPGEPRSLTEEPGTLQSTGSQRVVYHQSDPASVDARLFACGSSAPVRVKREGGAAAWLAGTLDCLTAGVMALSESFFKPLVAGHQKASLGSLFS